MESCEVRRDACFVSNQMFIGEIGMVGEGAELEELLVVVMPGILLVLMSMLMSLES